MVRVHLGPPFAQQMVFLGLVAVSFADVRLLGPTKWVIILNHMYLLFVVSNSVTERSEARPKAARAYVRIA